MINIRRSHERGHFDHGWLDTYHTFSFADYYDPQFMGFRSLRVINEDRVAPGQGFGQHSHRDMEILTLVISGELEHRDSLGNGEIIRPGEVQYMAAGTGVEHSEFNPSKSAAVHFLQIWIQPNRKDASPDYQERVFPSLKDGGVLTLLASADGRGESIRINQDARILAASLRPNQDATFTMEPGRAAWIQILDGSAVLNGGQLDKGDGAAVTGTSDLKIRANNETRFLLFDLA